MCVKQKALLLSIKLGWTIFFSDLYTGFGCTTGINIGGKTSCQSTELFKGGEGGGSHYFKVGKKLIHTNICPNVYLKKKNPAYQNKVIKNDE